MQQGRIFGSHSQTHPHVNQLTYEENVAEIEKSNETLEKIIGKRTTLYRPPYGEYNNTVIEAANEKGYFPIQWNLDTLDYTGLTGDQMWKRLEGKLKNGSIILMHNGAKHTADSLEMLIDQIQSQGYSICPVSELIYTGNYQIDVNGVQHAMSN